MADVTMRDAWLEPVVETYAQGADALHIAHTIRGDIPRRIPGRTEMSPKAQKILSTAIGTIGLALLIMMITTEGEPGAIPLALLLIGAVGHVSGRMRQRAPREPMRPKA